MRLSSVLTTKFVLRLGELHIEQEISRQDFERWIADDIARIEQTVDQLLQRESVSVDEIDSVFLTGGSSFPPFVACLRPDSGRIGWPTANIFNRLPLALH